MIDVRSLEVAAVFLLTRDVLVSLQGGTGTYARAEPRDRVPWPDGAELFLAWRCSRPAATAKANEQLALWQALGAPLRLLAGSGSRTVLMQDQHHRLLLPPLSPFGGAQPAVSGPR